MKEKWIQKHVLYSACLGAFGVLMGSGCDLTTPEDTTEDMASVLNDMAPVTGDMMVMLDMPADGGGTTDMGGSDQGDMTQVGVDMMVPPTPKDFEWNGGTVPVQLASGDSFTCALFDLGGVKCWGKSFTGARGVDSPRIREMPSVFPGYGSGVKSIYAGKGHACVQLQDGAVECWGNNVTGQLAGQDSSLPVPTPVRVSNLGNVAKLSLSVNTTCALRDDGDVLCWGSGDNGGLGNDKNYGSGDEVVEAPTFVKGLNGKVTDIVGTDNGHCVLIETGEVECWGTGNGTLLSSRYALRVPGLAEGVTKLFGGPSGGQICTVQNGESVCVGDAGSGSELGHGDSDYTQYPVKTRGLPNEEVIDVAMAENSTCWLMAGGDVFCAGSGNSGQLGNGMDSGTSIPDKVSLELEAVQISGGDRSYCAILSDDSVSCWGYGRNLGDDESDGDRSTPVPVAGLNTEELTPEYESNSDPLIIAPQTPPVKGTDKLAWTGGDKVVSIRTGETHTCGLYDQGGVRCWGFGGSQVFGEYVFVSSLPVEIPELGTGVTGLGSGFEASCALVDDDVLCWGSGLVNQLGRQLSMTSVGRPVRVPGLDSGIQDIHMSSGFGCAFYTDKVMCWGSNEAGRLGTGGAEEVFSLAADVTFAGPVAKFTKAYTQRFALLEDGSVQTWGDLAAFGNSYNVPTTVPGVSGVTDISAGGAHWCVIQAGALSCAGRNVEGQLGTGAITEEENALVEAVGLTGTPAKVVCGDTFTCVMFDDANSVSCTGTEVVDEPVANPNWVVIEGLHQGSSIIQMDATSDFACVLFDDGVVQCWGNNKRAELGQLNEPAQAVYTAKDVYGL